MVIFNKGIITWNIQRIVWNRIQKWCSNKLMWITDMTEYAANDLLEMINTYLRIDTLEFHSKITRI